MKYYFLCISILLSSLSVYGQKTDTTHSTMYIKKVPPKIVDTTKEGADLGYLRDTTGELYIAIPIEGSSKKHAPFYLLQRCRGIAITDIDLSNSLSYTLISFDLFIKHSGNVITMHSVGWRFTKEMTDLLKYLIPGDSITVQGVHYQIKNSGKVLTLKELNIKVIE